MLPKHRNLAKILYAEKTENIIYMAYEKFDVTIQDYVESQNNTIRAPIKMEMIRQILEGLSHIHICGYHHGNLNESNVLLKLVNEDKLKVKVKLSWLAVIKNKMVGNVWHLLESEWFDSLDRYLHSNHNLRRLISVQKWAMNWPTKNTFISLFFYPNWKITFSPACSTLPQTNVDSLEGILF